MLGTASAHIANQEISPMHGQGTNRAWRDPFLFSPILAALLFPFPFFFLSLFSFLIPILVCHQYLLVLVPWSGRRIQIFEVHQSVLWD